LRIVFVVQGAPADPPDHGSVPLDQGGEGPVGRGAIAGLEALQELTIRQPANGPGFKEQTDLSECLAPNTRYHR
jgi:hypothetical protein